MQERGTECREPGEWEEYYISGNVLKHSGKRPQTIRKNVLKHSGKCRQTFWGISPNIPEMSPIFLQSCQTSTMELFCENSQRPKEVDYFRKKAPPQMFHWILNEPSI